MGRFGYEKEAMVFHFFKKSARTRPLVVAGALMYGCDIGLSLSAKQQTSSTKLPDGDPCNAGVEDVGF